MLGTWTKYIPRTEVEYPEEEKIEEVLEHPCDDPSICEHDICRRTPYKTGVNYQCQCKPGFKPDPENRVKCIPGEKIIDETYCEDDEECLNNFNNSQCGAYACECRLGSAYNEKHTECVKEKEAEEQITMYHIDKDLIKIWEFKDPANRGDIGISIWRTTIKKAEVGDDGVAIDDEEDVDSFYNLGDVLVKGTNAPEKGYLFKPVGNKIPPFRLPESLEKVWDSSGMPGGSGYVSIWRPICPPKYVSVGLVATDSNKPQPGDIWCVRHFFTKAVKSQDSYRRSFIWSTDGLPANLKAALSLRHSTADNLISAQSFHVDKVSLPCLYNLKDIVPVQPGQKMPFFSA